MMSPLPLVPSLLTILLSLTTLASATTIDVVNNCNQPVWAAALPGGGRRLNKGETWTLRPADGTQGARIWGRTNCNFDSNGRGSCQTGDCAGVLDCRVSGANPQTLAEYTLGQTDFFDISLVDGFNLPIAFSPTTGGSGNCRSIQCSADVNGQCPAQLRAPGGCKSACTVFNTNQYCCFNGPQSCGPTPFSQYFKGKCPDAYSYAYDDQTSTFTCPHGTNYRVTFCP